MATAFRQVYWMAQLLPHDSPAAPPILLLLPLLTGPSPPLPGAQPLPLPLRRGGVYRKWLSVPKLTGPAPNVANTPLLVRRGVLFPLLPLCRAEPALVLSTPLLLPQPTRFPRPQLRRPLPSAVLPPAGSAVPPPELHADGESPPATNAPLLLLHPTRFTRALVARAM